MAGRGWWIVTLRYGVDNTGQYHGIMTQLSVPIIAIKTQILSTFHALDYCNWTITHENVENGIIPIHCIVKMLCLSINDTLDFCYFLIYKSFKLDDLLKVARALDHVHGLLGAGEDGHLGAQVLIVPVLSDRSPDSPS